MIQVKWLVQEDVFNEDFTDFFSALKRNNTSYHIHKHIPFASDFECPFDNDECVISYGSLNLIKIVKRTKKWIPGYWCNFDAFKCLSYYAYYGEYLTNRDYSIIPFQEIFRLKEKLYEEFGDPIFIRPDRGDKPFTGHYIPRHEFDSETNFLKSMPAVNSELTIIVSSFKNIIREWRFIVSNNMVISGSLYKTGEEITQEICESGEAYNLALKISSETWKPDPVFVVDICETDEGLSVLEINSFSCSGFYAADKNKIVQEINRIALLEMNDTK